MASQSSVTPSTVFETKVNLSPDILKSSWTPKTLHTVSYGNSLSLDSFHLQMLKRDVIVKSVCLLVALNSFINILERERLS